MTSRLDRLFLLLETGSTSVTRKAAAKQLGEVQRLHPHELNNLLAKVRHYLHSSSWDTRIAASQAVEAIVSNVPLWLPSGIKSEIQDTLPACTSNPQKQVSGRMSFSQFDINTVIKCGNNLLASEGKEYDESQDASSSGLIPSESDLKEKLAVQRQQLNQKLGLDVAMNLGLDLDSHDFVSNEDLANDVMSSGCGNDKPIGVDSQLKGTQEGEMNEIVAQVTGRSVKRKLKSTDGKNVGRRMSLESDNGKDVKKSKLNNDENSSSNSTGDLTIDTTHSDEWLLEGICDELMYDLFNANWEVRHGAATALREIIKLQGKCGGRTKNGAQDQMDSMNQLWLEDLALRLTCVLALDKFGDFVSDQVVAPVRETCAQSLGLILNLLTTNGVNNVLKILLQLLSRPEWEARHGGLLGIKYLLAIRKDLTRDLLPIVFQPIFDSLKDSIDDVSAVAAAALIPIKDVLIDLMPDKIPIMIDYLWDSLLDLDDLSSSTGDLLMLLSSLLTFNSNSTNLSCLTQLVPRLWPFLSHSLSSVRKSVLESLLILTTKDTSWITSSLLADALRLLFQRCLFEHRDPILLSIYNVWYQFVTKSSIDDLLLASCPHLSGWICLMMHPSRVAIDPDNCPSWMEAKSMNHHSETQHLRRNKFEHEIMNKDVREKYYLGGSESLGETAEQREIFVIRARIQAAKAIGLLASRIAKHECLISDENSSPIQCFANVLLFHLNSKSAIQRMCIGWTINEWAKAQFASDTSNQSKLLTSINDKCLECLQDFLYFDEISSSFTRLQHETRELVALMSQHKLPIDSNIYKPNMIYTLDQISSLVNTSPNKLNITKIKPKIAEQIECKTKSLSRSLSELTKLQSSLNITVQSSLAGAIVSWKQLPLKLNPIVRPLMDSIKSEENEQLQQQASKNLVDLMRICCDRTSNSPSPIPKIIKNLISYLCCDCNFTPNIELQTSKTQGITLMTSTSSSSSSESSSPATSQIANNESVILTLEKMLKLADKMSSMRRSNSITAGKKSKKEMGNSSEEVVIMTNQNEERQNEIIRRGASQVLSMAAQNFAEELPAKLEHLWEQIIYVKNHESNDVQTIQNLINSLQVLEVTAPYLNSKLHADLIQLLPHLCLCLESQHAAVRHMSSRCIGMLSEVIHQPTMDMVLTRVIQLLEVSDSEIKRQGAIETIYCVIEKLGLNIVPYIVLLIVPMLGRMSDQNHQVRSLATNCFAQLVQLFPLDNGNNNSDIKPEISDELLQRKESERHFLEQLMNMKNVDNYEIPVAIKAELRSYQKDGVNWLAFLSKYKLHGIVADEMGLGKTLQTICILASDHFYRGQKYDKNKNEDCKPLMSIAICPPTLTGHWVYEVQKFISEQYLHALHYTGPPNERTKLRNKLKKNMSKQTYNLVIASYDIVRNDIEFFSSIHWNYCILDEGHVIKNGKTKLSKAIKSLSANHRLILTGTPIQNNVIELWSLFDFLMPGLLGTERQFMAKYSRPILQSRDAKSSSKEQEAGVLAMESLHRQVLPFILRRMKEDVLSDLPPKIMQDYYCELSSLQSQLYEDFAKSRANQTLHNSINSNSKTSEKNEKNEKNCSHIFQALQYLRKVCNHPKLVLTPQHPQYDSIVAKIKTNNSSLSDINHASKLCALKQLLMDCGIGTQTTTLINGSEPVVNQHRALVFFQLKSMLDIVEFDLFKAHMPSVSYLRLDGSIPPSNRHSVVHRFNNDPSIDVLLLTTQVGGLGLNLTGADTVIFVEHDWNPMKDLQAMDRAHRIGQKKVVNVYRLITTGTLEEKIMGLQKFKLTIANTVISSDNSSLQTMATEQLLDLFNLDKNKEKNEKSESAHNSNSGSGIKNLIENLPELWENEEYESEYDLDQFMSTLKS